MDSQPTITAPRKRRPCKNLRLAARQVLAAAKEIDNPQHRCLLLDVLRIFQSIGNDWLTEQHNRERNATNDHDTNETDDPQKLAD